MKKGLIDFLQTLQRGAIRSRGAIQSLTWERPRFLAVLNGLIGDTLEAHRSPMATKMKLLGEVRGPKLCILVHGLCDSETTWQYSEDSVRSYGSHLQQDLGYTPLYLRYNSGLHISSNGRSLARLLGKINKRNFKSVREIIFIGHSLGGLVVRSACHYGQEADAPWVNRIKKIFFLGTPHLGSDWEKLGNLTSTLLHKIPNFVTKGLAALGNRRSAAIKDLRFGYLLDEDWKELDPDALWKDNRHPVPLLKGVDYYLIGAALAKKSDNFFTQYFGDGLVPSRSAAGRSFLKEKSIPFSRDHFKLIKGISHGELARHGEVYEHIRRWCGFAG